MTNKFSQIIENKNPKTKIKKENNFLFFIEYTSSSDKFR
jgi:hypothetical protein